MGVLVLLLDMTMAAKYLVKTGGDDGDDTSYTNYGADITGGGTGGDDGNDDVAGMMSDDTTGGGRGGDDDGEGDVAGMMSADTTGGGDGGGDDGDDDLAEDRTFGQEEYQPRPSVGGGHLHYEPVQHKHG